MALAYLLRLLGAITKTRAASRRFVRMYLCHCFFGDKKLTHSNTFSHHAKPVVESVPSLISPLSCFSEDTEHYILSSRLDRFRDAVVPSVCAEAVCVSSSSFQSISSCAVCFSFRDVHCLVAQIGELNYLVARVPVPSALNNFCLA